MSGTALIVEWAEMPRWDVKTARAAAFRDAHPDYRSIGDFVEDATALVRPWEEPDKEWPVYGVNNVDGVVLSHVQKGSSFNASYKRIRHDDFFHNPTRANVGSLGRVWMDVPEDAITSPEYQIWRITGGLLPAYVEILIKMPFFLDLVDCHRVGGVKERLFTANLMDIPIPVLSPREQEAVVAYWREANDRAKRIREDIRAIEEDAEREILRALGATLPPFVPRPRAFEVMWSDTDMWGVGFNRWTWTLDTLLESSLPTVPLGEVARINPPAPRGMTPMNPDIVVTFVLMEAVDDIAGEIMSPRESTLAEVGKGYTRFIEGDVLWAKITPCMQNGKCAVARGLIGGTGFGSTEFHVARPINPRALLPDYLWALLRLPHVRQAAQRYFTGSAGQQRVAPSFLEGLRIPLPEPDGQQEVVSVMQGKRAEMKRRRAEMASVLSQAKVSAQAMILGARVSR